MLRREDDETCNKKDAKKPQEDDHGEKEYLGRMERISLGKGCREAVIRLPSSSQADRKMPENRTREEYPSEFDEVEERSDACVEVGSGLTVSGASPREAVWDDS